MDVTHSFFADERGRVLRVSWHEEDGLVLLSVWRDDRCVGSVRLNGEDAARLASLLVDRSESAPG